MRRIAIVLLGSALLAGSVLPSFAQEELLLPRGGPGGGGPSRMGGPGGGGPEGGGGPPRMGGPGRGPEGGGMAPGGPRGGGPGPRAGGLGPRPEGFGNGPRYGGGPRFGNGPDADGYRRRHRGGYGAAVGAGVAGLAAGALIGGALATPNTYGGDYGDDGYYGPAYAGPGYVQDDAVEDVAPATSGDSVAYCQQRYRSYDVASGTYLGYDGIRHPCP